MRNSINVFICGHRDLEYQDFLNYYVPEINSCITEYLGKDITFFVGAAEGCDKFVANYISAVFKDIERIHLKICTPKEFGSFEEADQFMLCNAECLIANIYRDRADSCTARNILKFYEICEKID